MGREKKRSSAKGSTELISKRLNPIHSLTDLPIELVNIIIDYNLYDLGNVMASINKNSSAKMYTSPILQTSRFFRQQALSLLDKQTIWIRIKFYSPAGPPDSFLRLSEIMPTIPPQFQYLIAPESPTVNLELDDPGIISRKPTRSALADAFILPFSMVTCLSIYRLLSDLAKHSVLHKITIKYENMTRRDWRALNLTVIPATTELRHFRDCEVTSELAQWCKDWSPGCFHTRKWNMTALVGHAEWILKRIDKLEQLAYFDDAALLLLRQYWIMSEAARAPELCNWARAQFSTTPSALFWSSEPLSNPNLQGNKLRGLQVQLLYRTCLAYARLVDNYGISQSATLLSNRRDRPLRTLENYEPFGCWFGISEIEQAQLHYGFGVLHAAFAKAILPQGGVPSLKTALHHTALLRKAAVRLDFASRLQPGNETMRARYASCKAQLSPEEAEQAQQECSDRWRVVTVPSIIPNTPDVTWRGDSRALQAWGGEAILQYLPLARKLPDDTASSS